MVPLERKTKDLILVKFSYFFKECAVAFLVCEIVICYICYIWCDTLPHVLIKIQHFK